MVDRLARLQDGELGQVESMSQELDLSDGDEEDLQENFDSDDMEEAIPHPDHIGYEAARNEIPEQVNRHRNDVSCTPEERKEAL